MRFIDHRNRAVGDKKTFPTQEHLAPALKLTPLKDTHKGESSGSSIVR